VVRQSFAPAVCRVTIPDNSSEFTAPIGPFA